MPLKPATRVGVRPLVGLYGESGCGKSMSALLMARGFVGPNGRIGQADSEKMRGSLYADVIPGGYETLSIDEPYTPELYVRAIEEIENSGVHIGVLDSGSHEWEFGVLGMAAENEERGGKGLNVWRKPKMEHAFFVQKLLSSKIPWIICLRGKYKSRQTKEGNKTVIIKDDVVTPIQDDNFLFELTAKACLNPNHTLSSIAVNHPGLVECFPKNGPIEIRHGELLAQWCQNAGRPSAASAPKPTTAPAQSVAVLKKELWAITKEHHQDDAGAFAQFLVDEMLIPDNKQIGQLTAGELLVAINKYKEKFGA